MEPPQGPPGPHFDNHYFKVVGLATTVYLFYFGQAIPGCGTDCSA